MTPTTAAPTRNKRPFGTKRKLPSGQWQAYYTGPDKRRHYANGSFDDADAAGMWLRRIKRDIDDGVWDPNPKTETKHQTVSDAFDAYLLKPRAKDLAPRTAEHYEKLYDRFMAKPLGDLVLPYVTEEVVNAWYMDKKLWLKSDGKVMRTYRAHAYQLLSSMMANALPRGAANPCQITRGGASKSDREIRPATLVELDIMADAMPAQWAALIPLTAWCALRFGEATELRRGDIRIKDEVIRIHRGVTRAKGEVHVGAPKAESIRNVTIPPHLIPVLEKHLRDHVGRSDSALLFPAVSGPGHVAYSTLHRHFDAARIAAGRPDLHFHDLRHTGGTLIAAAGATLAESMARLGHKTPAMALRYQHVATGRPAELAANLSRLAGQG